MQPDTDGERAILGTPSRIATAAGGNETRCARPDFVISAGTIQTPASRSTSCASTSTPLGAPLAEQEKHLEARAERPSGIANGFPEDRDFPIGERAPRPVQTLRTSPAFPTPPGERGHADQPRLGGPSEEYRSDLAQLLCCAWTPARLNSGNTLHQRE
jgi:hypothetical protein